MVRPWTRKRSAATAAAEAEAEAVHLTGDEHPWWAQSEVTEVWKPKTRRTPDQQDAEDKRDILAEHLGDDWRTSFGFTPPAEDSPDDGPPGDRDPYQVLGIQSTASWAEIVVAHRDLARLHHPDRLLGQPEEEKAKSEELIRLINIAYQELQVRRGK